MKHLVGWVVAGLGLSVAGLVALAAGDNRKLAVGEAAPPFALAGSDGKTHRLSDHLGIRPVVIAWFPKAKTPG